MLLFKENKEMYVIWFYYQHDLKKNLNILKQIVFYLCIYSIVFCFILTKQ